MKTIFKNISYLSLILIALSSCQSLKDNLEGNKKSKSAEEFLIQKKNPLVLPPDFSKLPIPNTTVNQEKSKQDFDLKNILEKNSISTQNNQSKNNSSLEKSIIGKIKKN